ncbi:MAG: phenylalanine--tRNA ligase subunit beta, partial [Pseudomonadales bacterium]
RMAKASEAVTLLDGQGISLNDDTLLITDDAGAIGIAGIMGGRSTAVTDASANIFLESAFFAPTIIAGRARSYGLNTDASHRFERGVDWQGQARAVERATALLLAIAGGEAGPTVETVAEASLPSVKYVELRASRVKRLLGVEIADADIERMLGQLHFDFERHAEAETAWTVTAPSHRFDIAIEADLIEEISRIYGYNTLPVRTPTTSLAMVPAPEGELTVNAIKDQLVARGYFEAVTYSFVDAKSEGVLDPANEPIGLANPLSSEMGVMRTTLWTGLIKSLLYNVNRQQSRVRLFETGLRFLQSPNQADVTMDTITQELMVAGVATGPRQAENWGNGSGAIDFFDVKGDIETVIALTGSAAEFSFEAGEHSALHPGQTARILRNGELVGYLGLLDPRAQQALDVDQPVYLFELRASLLTQRRIPAAVSLSRFPEVRRDIA